MKCNPFCYLHPVEPEHFVGRWALVNSIAQDLALETGDSHAIIAGQHCGKTSFLLALLAQLQTCAVNEPGNDLPVPVYIDFRAVTFASAEALFACILYQVYAEVSQAVQRLNHLFRASRLRFSAHWFEQLVNRSALSSEEFEESMLYLLEQLDDAVRPVNLVLLIDESGQSLDQPWTNTLYNQARNLLCNRAFKRHVRLVLATSQRFLEQGAMTDLTLCGMLKLHCLQVFDEAALAELFVKSPNVSSALQTAIQRQSGGHPFLAQYLLYHLWEQPQSALTADADEVIAQLVARFLHERSFEMEAWAYTLEATGMQIYQYLSTAAGWVEEEQIVAATDAAVQRVKRALLALCTQGLAIHDASWHRFRYTGEIFRQMLNPI